MQSELFATEPLALDLPDADIQYYEDFLSHADADYQQLLDEIDWRQDTIMLYGRPVVIPRLNAWYGDPDANYSYSGLVLKPHAWTPTLQKIRLQVEQFLGTAFNSVLANLYRDGNDSVAWHSDDEVELGENPVIASVSLGATRKFSLRHRNNTAAKRVDIELKTGSLLVMAGTTQHYWHHQVAKTNSMVGGRINLTFRQIVSSR